VRTADKPPASFVDAVRAAIAGQTLTIGVVPALAGDAITLPAGSRFSVQGTVTLQVDVPLIDASGGLVDSLNRVPQYRTLDSGQTNDIFTEPGAIDVTLLEKTSSPSGTISIRSRPAWICYHLRSTTPPSTTASSPGCASALRPPPRPSSFDGHQLRTGRSARPHRGRSPAAWHRRTDQAVVLSRAPVACAIGRRLRYRQRGHHHLDRD